MKLCAGYVTVSALREDKKIPNAISTKDILEWHQPESIRDVLDSIGEIDAVSEYPMLQIFPGTVLIDPKIRHRDPALNW